MTAAERAAVRAASDGRCVYCRRAPGRRPLVIEHMVPLSRGGDDAPENAALACQSCNTAKGSMTPLEFLLCRVGIWSPPSRKYRRPARPFCGWLAVPLGDVLDWKGKPAKKARR